MCQHKWIFGQQAADDKQLKKEAFLGSVYWVGVFTVNHVTIGNHALNSKKNVK